MFALHGRAFAKWPMLIYTVYVVVIVCFMQVGRGKYGVGESSAPHTTPHAAPHTFLHCHNSTCYVPDSPQDSPHNYPHRPYLHTT